MVWICRYCDELPHPARHRSDAPICAVVGADNGGRSEAAKMGFGHSKADHDVVMALVRAANQDEIDDPKIITTAINNTAIRATRRPYSVTAMAESERRNRRIDRISSSMRMG